YIVEVEHCKTGEVVYSYEIGDLENIDIIPCKSRAQPKSCYSLLFTLLGPEKQVASIHSASLDIVEGVTFEANQIQLRKPILTNTSSVNDYQ
ncbi:MAG: hypothetical protein OEQ53_22620, partial [Saprospiraceae bacterium]|nr:hypothetical protein [Saprospiraceae bacterium]